MIEPEGGDDMEMCLHAVVSLVLWLTILEVFQ